MNTKTPPKWSDAMALLRDDPSENIVSRIKRKSLSGFPLIVSLLVTIFGLLFASTPAALAQSGTGLRGDYFNNMTLSGSPALTRTDATVNLQLADQSPGAPLGSFNYSVRWTGQVQPQYSQTYTFYTNSDDGVRLWINGVQLVNNWTDHSPTENSGTIALTAGQLYSVTMEFYQNGGGATAQLSWSSSSTPKALIPTNRLYVPATGPAAPSGVTATAVSSSQINVAWTDNSNNENIFKIQRKTGAGGTWSQVSFVGTNVTTYQDTGLTAGTQYYYRVVSNNTNGDSGFSNEANATTQGGGTAPSAPTSLSAMTINNARIDLSWTDTANNETGFKIERKTGSGGTYAQIATTGANVTTYSNTGLATATQYYYRVRANNAVGDSAFSGEANATTTAGPPPAVPSGLTATVVSSSQINLAWTDNSNNENIFKIQRKTGAGGTWSQVGFVGTNVNTFQNTGLTAATQYYYRVVSNNTNGDSSPSNEANATTQGTVVAPAAPSALSASAASSSQINLSWTDNSGVETGFKIERKTGSGGTYSQIATTGANVTTYQNTGLTASTQYYYRVRANNSAGDSAYSNEANATTQSAPGTPNGTGLRGDYYSNMNLIGSPALTRTDATVNFNWPDSPGAGIPGDGFSVRWTGEVQPQYSETYTFYSGADDGTRLWVNGVQLVSDWFNHPYQEHSGVITLSAGQKYNITYEFYENAGGAEAQLFWSSPSQPKQIIPQIRLYPAAGSPPPGANFYQIIAKYWDGYGGNFASTYVYVPDSIPPNNTAPVVNSVTASPNSIGAGGTVNLSASATDANGDPLQYFWVVPAGHLGWSKASTDTWKAPTVAGTYSIQVMVGDGKVWSSGTVNVVVNSNGNNVSPGNHIASMTSIQASKTTVAPGETISLTVTQTDRDPHPNGDYNYAWVASGGSLNTAELSVNTNSWTAPSSPSNPSGRLVKPGFILWPRQAPDQATCPFPLSTSIVGVGLTGRASRQHFSDTWMPSWGADDKLISPWQDGGLSTPPFNTLPPNNPSDNRNGWAILEGSDPMDLMTTSAGVFDRISVPLGNNCYPGAVFTKDNVIYYGLRNFRLTNSSGALVKWEDGFQRLAPTRFLGFHTSTDNGQTWNRTTHTESNPLFNEPDPAHVKFGQIYMVDFGRNQQHSPDGKVYFVSNGSLSSDSSVDPLNEDGVYLCRVTPSVANINNASSWEFYGNGTWSNSIANATPIAAWENHFNGATVVYNPGLNKFLMTCYKGEFSNPTPTTVHLEDDDTFILEADSLTGPWRMVMYWNSFGAQAYYANIPSKFISGDGKTAWLWYGANFELGVKPEDPFGSGYRLTQQQIRFLTPADLQ